MNNTNWNSRDTKKQNRIMRHIVSYIIAAVVLVAVSQIYLLFSHGVFSWAMALCFLPSLVGGICSTFIRPRPAVNLLGSAVACATAGMLLKGVFEISGGVFGYPLYYFIAAGVFLLAALITAFAVFLLS
ncbi:MAG: hypothetical protein LBN42_01765 [Oscillospiraceae bacterium]|jgi:hypothetical protein|nr:hypothetical protein [Oscillospiraceae bacterium]